MPEQILIDDAKICIAKLTKDNSGALSGIVERGGMLRPRKGDITNSLKQFIRNSLEANLDRSSQF